MPRFPKDSLYLNVNEIAEEQDLIWDGQYGSPYDIEEMIRPELRDRRGLEEYRSLFDHTKRFKPRGSGQKKPVLAISSPYVRDDSALRAKVAEFASRFGLEARVNDPRDRIYDVDSTVPILFWRRGMAAANRNESIETADIMPTLAASIGLPVDATKIDGQCISVQGITCPAR